MNNINCLIFPVIIANNLSPVRKLKVPLRHQNPVQTIDHHSSELNLFFSVATFYPVHWASIIRINKMPKTFISGAEKKSPEIPGSIRIKTFKKSRQNKLINSLLADELKSGFLKNLDIRHT
jgi:hypothetical protein